MPWRRNEQTYLPVTDHVPVGLRRWRRRTIGRRRGESVRVEETTSSPSRWGNSSLLPSLVAWFPGKRGEHIQMAKTFGALSGQCQPPSCSWRVVTYQLTRETIYWTFVLEATVDSWQMFPLGKVGGYFITAGEGLGQIARSVRRFRPRKKLVELSSASKIPRLIMWAVWTPTATPLPFKTGLSMLFPMTTCKCFSNDK